MTRLREGFRFPGGFHLDSRVRGVMVGQWNRLRIAASTPAILAGLAGGLFGFDRAWIVVASAMVVLVHGWSTRRHPDGAMALGIDIAVSFLILESIGAPLPVLSIAYVSYGVIVTLLCGPVARVVLGVLASVLLAGAVMVDLAGGGTTFIWSQVAGWIAALIFVALLLATVAMTVDLLQDNVEAVDRANRQLEALTRSKDELIATVSHAIRTPLAATLGFSTELRDAWETFSPVERQELAGVIATESQDVAYIVDDLIVAARVDLGSLAIHLEPIHLHAEIGRFFSQYTRAHRPIEVMGEDFQIAVDRGRFRQILRNLVSNAIAYGGERVWIETEVAPDMGVVRVCDDGAGIAEERQDLVFAPYQRAHENPTQPGSFGLGLTVARRLAEAMGGSLTYRRLNAVSVFTVTLPRTEEGRPRWTAPVEDTQLDAATHRPLATDHTGEEAPMEAVPVGVAGISRWVGTGDRGWWLSLWERPMGYRWHR